MLISFTKVGMKPLSERDENSQRNSLQSSEKKRVGMKPLSERDENAIAMYLTIAFTFL